MSTTNSTPAWCKSEYLELTGGGDFETKLSLYPVAPHALTSTFVNSLTAIGSEGIKALSGTENRDISLDVVEVPVGYQQYLQPLYLQFVNTRMYLADPETHAPYPVDMTSGWFLPHHHPVNDSTDETRWVMSGQLTCMRESGTRQAELYLLNGVASFDVHDISSIMNAPNSQDVDAIDKWYQSPHTIDFVFRCGTTGSMQTLRAQVSRQNQMFFQPNTLYEIEVKDSFKLADRLADTSRGSQGSIDTSSDLLEAIWKATQPENDGSSFTVSAQLRQWSVISEDRYEELGREDVTDDLAAMVL